MDKPEVIAKELNRSLDKLKTGNARSPVFSPTLAKLLTEAWTWVPWSIGAEEVRSGFAVVALLSDNELLALGQGHQSGTLTGSTRSPAARSVLHR